MDNDNLKFNKLKGVFVDVLKTKNRTCLCPYNKCKNKTANCHSVQDSRILSSLADKGHVHMIKPNIGQIQQNMQTIPLQFQRLSVHKATTFSGLCNKHDSEMFEAIDTGDLDLKNPQHAFLLTYRSVLKEFAVLIESENMIQAAFKEKIKNGIINQVEYGAEIIDAAYQILKAKSFSEYKRKFDELFCARKYNGVCYRSIVLATKCRFAVSTTFSTLEMSAKKDVPNLITINVFPYHNGTYVLFSALAEDEAGMEAYLQEFFNSTGYHQLYVLSKIILRNCENIAFAPDLVESWPERKKAAILQYFEETGTTDKVGYENKELFLF